MSPMKKRLALGVLLLATPHNLVFSQLPDREIKKGADGSPPEQHKLVGQTSASESAGKHLSKPPAKNDKSFSDHQLELVYLVTPNDMRGRGSLPGVLAYFWSESRSAVYQFMLDARTGKLDDKFMCVYDVALDAQRNFSSENAFKKWVEECSRSSSVQSIAFGQEDALKQFKVVLPKYLEWKEKAEELRPDPFRKLLPNSQMKQGPVPTAVNFLWAPNSKNGDSSPEAQLEFVKSQAGRSYTDLILNMREVAAIEGALAARPSAESQLSELLSRFKDAAAKQQRKVQDNFN